METTKITGKITNHDRPRQMSSLELAYYLFYRRGSRRLTEKETNWLNRSLINEGRQGFCRENKFTIVFEAQDEIEITVHRYADKTSILTRAATPEEIERERVQKQNDRVADTLIPRLEAAIRAGDMSRVAFLQNSVANQVLQIRIEDTLIAMNA